MLIDSILCKQLATSLQEKYKALQNLAMFQDENLQGKLQSKEKAASDLEVKNKTLKSDLTRKNKQIKELEREVSCI